MSETCATCAYWSGDLPPLARSNRRPEGNDGSVGVCQFYPPEIVRAGGLWMSLFPEVHADRTCGEWSPGMPVDDGGGERADAPDDNNVVPFGKAAA